MLAKRERMILRVIWPITGSFSLMPSKRSRAAGLVCTRKTPMPTMDNGQQQHHVPVGNQRVGDEEHLGLRRRLLPHVLHELFELRHHEPSGRRLPP